MISVKNLVKIYGSGDNATTVLSNISLDVPNGQFVSIIGPSGAGKSTLLYQMSLLDKPTRGSIKINGTETTNQSETESTRFRLNNFGFIFQDYSLVPELTGIENIIVASLMAGIDKSEAVSMALRILRDLEVDNVKNHLPSQMSGGEQQRVSIARAVVRSPEILFADEPTASLDTKRSEEVLDVLKKLNKNGQTIVMVTHEMEYANLTDRIIEIIDGKIVNDKTLK